MKFRAPTLRNIPLLRLTCMMAALTLDEVIEFYARGETTKALTLPQSVHKKLYDF